MTARLGNYAIESVRVFTALRAKPTESEWVLRSYAKWADSVAPQTTPMQQGLPWITYGAIDYLARQIGPGSRVFEYGSGGSTIFMSRLGASGVSVEHDESWQRLVEDKLRAELPDANWRVLHVPAEERGLAHPKEFRSSSPEFALRSFERYVRSIESFEPESLDLVVVDGRSRNACVHHAANRVKPGGSIVLDNSERIEYRRAAEHLEGSGWIPVRYFGPLPCTAHFGCTTVFTKPR